MPLFEIGPETGLIPFRRLRGGAELYEREIEDLLWSNIEDFTGEPLFTVARQPRLVMGGVPDVIALDRVGRVVVIEVKRDVDRSQLAQCLEYAGWARITNLDELAAMYHLGPDQFWPAWQDFTGSDVPVRVQHAPRLVLVAREFHGRTESAFEFLIENGLPVRLIRVSLYEDERGRRFVDVEGDHEPVPAASAIDRSNDLTARSQVDGRRVQIGDLLDAGLLIVGDSLVWERPRVGRTYRATIAENGAIVLEDGRAFSTPSRAAVEAAQVPSCDGWLAWRLERDGGELLAELRTRLIESQARDDLTHAEDPAP